MWLNQFAHLFRDSSPLPKIILKKYLMKCFRFLKQLQEKLHLNTNTIHTTMKYLLVALLHRTEQDSSQAMALGIPYQFKGI